MTAPLSLPGVTYSRTVYTAGRVCAVATRPLCLFIANNFLLAETARGLAVAFLLSSMALLVTAADPHRSYYLSRFSTEPRTTHLTFYVYVVSAMLLALIGGAAVAAAGSWHAESLPLLLATVVYFSTEKIADEVLRLKLFDRDFHGWGVATLRRSALQGLALVMVLLVGTSRAAAVPLILLMAAATAAVFVQGLPLVALRSLLSRPTTLWRLAWRSVSSIVARRMLWAVALVGAGIGYLDRIVALGMDARLLPLFMLVVMTFSIVQLAVDFYYVSVHRRDFLERRVTILDALRSRDFLVSVTGGVAAGLLASLIVLKMSRNGGEFRGSYLAAIAVLQTSIAITAVPQQILYWNRDLRRILLTDAAFWLCFGLAVIAIRLLHWGPAALLAAVGLCGVARLGAYIVQSWGIWTREGGSASTTGPSPSLPVAEFPS